MQKGFTLIELIIVIVIIGILAVTAAPRFIEINKEATVAKLQTMVGALDSSYRLMNMKAVLQGVTNGQDSISLNGVSVDLREGYPSADWNDSIRYMLNLDTVEFFNINRDCDLDWCGRGNQTNIPSGISVTPPQRIAKIYPRGYSYFDECGVYYINRSDGNPPEIGIETDDC